MKTVLKITNWTITAFFVYGVLSTFFDLFFELFSSQPSVPCIIQQISFLLVIALPLSFIILTISIFEIRKLTKGKDNIKKWIRVVYWTKASISSIVALGLMILFAIVFVDEFF